MAGDEGDRLFIDAVGVVEDDGGLDSDFLLLPKVCENIPPFFSGEVGLVGVGGDGEAAAS